MPFRVRSKANKGVVEREASPAPVLYDAAIKLPDIEQDDDFRHVVKKLSV